MKRLCYMIVVLVLLMLVVSCGGVIKGVAQILDGSHEVNGIVTQVTKDDIVIGGKSVKNTLLAADPQGEWKTNITKKSVHFMFVPSKDIPADSAGFPKKALRAGTEYPIVIEYGETESSIRISDSDILGDIFINTGGNGTDGSGSGTDGSGSAKKKIVIVATPQTKSELQALIEKRIKRDGNNADLNDIDVRKITDMRELFKDSPFNGDISQWDVSSVRDMQSMFLNSKFNSDISQWNVSKVMNMQSMFYESPFNQDISGWDVSSVTDMGAMFGETPFNQDISGWDVSNVNSMHGMFYNSSFNQDISGWDVSSVMYMIAMFKQSPFNQDISGWDVSSVTDMSLMFQQSPFNGDISQWDVSSVTDMQSMFQDSQFNQDISQWDVSSVTDMSLMFSDAKKMTYNLEAWGSKLQAGVKKDVMWIKSGVDRVGNLPSWA